MDRNEISRREGMMTNPSRLRASCSGDADGFKGFEWGLCACFLVSLSKLYD